jgi:hypothetical protein
MNIRAARNIPSQRRCHVPCPTAFGSDGGFCECVQVRKLATVPGNAGSLVGKLTIRIYRQSTTSIPSGLAESYFLIAELARKCSSRIADETCPFDNWLLPKAIPELRF